jgi:UDP-glucose 4-epimerase
MDTDGFRTLSFRMFSVYGPGQDLAELRQGMVSIYLTYILSGEPVAVRGPLDRVRDLIYIDDVVAAWRAALERPARGALNLGAGEPVSVRQLIDELAEACGLESGYPVDEQPGTPGDQRAVWADISRAREELGWEPRTPRANGLAALVAWARDS